MMFNSFYSFYTSRDAIPELIYNKKGHQFYLMTFCSVGTTRFEPANLPTHLGM